MLVVAYQDRGIRNESELFEAYIGKQLNNPDSQGTYPPKKSPIDILPSRDARDSPQLNRSAKFGSFLS